MNKRTIFLIGIIIALPVTGYFGLRMLHSSYQEMMQIGPEEKYEPKYPIPVPGSERLKDSSKVPDDSIHKH